MKKASIFLLLLLWLNEAVCQDFGGVDSVITEAIRENIFPGASVLVGNREDIIYSKTYGKFTYDESSLFVDENSLFDLASLTKVFATTFCIMKLYDEGKISLNDKVVRYIPDFAENGKEDVEIINLLLHNSSLPAYYTPAEGQSREDILGAVFSIPPAYKIGEKTIYSCLNFVTLMQIVETVTGKTLSEYYYDVYTKSLGLTNTMFSPPAELKERCMPTTPELQGIVHDPLARGLLGFSGNAGLFSTAADLSKLCRILLNSGTIDGKEYLSEETVRSFTRRYSEKSTRALGWDTRSDTGYTSAGKLYSPDSYGHTGYTGTSVWFDPEREIYALLLTNRVYPDDKKSIAAVRPKLYDAVIESLEK